MRRANLFIHLKSSLWFVPVLCVLAGAAATAVYASSKGWAVVIPAEAWSGGIAAAILIGAFAGLAFGIYIPVDQALFIDVLPDQRAAGRDLGVANLGSSLGQALGPLLASLVVVLTGGYLGIWIVAFVLVGFAAVAIVPVKGVK